MLRASMFQDPSSGSERTGAARIRRPKPLQSLTARLHSFVPRLETLEDRTVPSGGYVFQTIDPPLAAQVSIPTLINSSGEIVGAYTDANSVLHGYLLGGGQYTTLDDPAGVFGNQADSINNSGKVVGAHIDANGVFHGYLATKAHGDFAMGSQGAERASPPLRHSVMSLTDTGMVNLALVKILCQYLSRLVQVEKRLRLVPEFWKDESMPVCEEAPAILPFGVPG